MDGWIIEKQMRDLYVKMGPVHNATLWAEWTNGRLRNRQMGTTVFFKSKILMW